MTRLYPQTEYWIVQIGKTHLNVDAFITTCKRSCGKVIFSQASVYPQIGGVSRMQPRWMHRPPGYNPDGYTPIIQPLLDATPSGWMHPLRMDAPPPPPRRQKVNRQAICIPVLCILVLLMFVCPWRTGCIPACILTGGVSLHAPGRGVCIPAYTLKGECGCLGVQASTWEGMGVCPGGVDVQGCGWVCVDRGWPGATPPPAHILPETATEAGGTYPTGMHSYVSVMLLCFQDGSSVVY